VTEAYGIGSIVMHRPTNKMLSYSRETAMQGALVLATSGKLGDNILRTL